ncbi:energy transducer TonB [Hyphomicrobium sp.]|uniref:energy transducer TonB family protein n=1 Tax=Hyphomicrobium sp. TaxID=82 RepID=UPI000FA4686F|nr:energy transducer TonB [Hyphomicrobium sp.]RUP00653.1 MAG: energy transducer TonB [Hyphomicrobium sp.]
MTAENVGQTAGLSIAGFAHWSAGTTKRERNFYIALAVAALLHASFFISAAQNGSSAKRLGSENGADDAISVSLVTEQDLNSKVTFADQVSPPPGPVAPTQQEEKAKPQQQPQEQKPPTPPQPEQAKQEPQPPQPEQPPPQETPQQQETAQPDLPQDVDPAKPEPKDVAKPDDTAPDSQPPDLFSLQNDDPTKMQSANEPKPKPQPKPEPKHEPKKPSTTKQANKSSAKAQKKVAALDFSTQALAPSFSGGGGAAAFQRPPGITRSGLNDAFARAVIRALQQTMPQLTNTLGRVTVRILLSESGNVVDVKLLAGSKDSSLNQDVVFAAKQTSYPIPPAGSNLADRTFMVTYIYD